MLSTGNKRRRSFGKSVGRQDRVPLVVSGCDVREELQCFLC